MGNITISGSVNDAVVVSGNSNVVENKRLGNSHQGPEIGKLLALMQELRTGIADAEIDPDYKKMLSDNLKHAEAAAQKEKPKPLLVSGPIDAVKNTLEQILQAGGKVEKLISMAQKLGEMVARVGLGVGL